MEIDCTRDWLSIKLLSCKVRLSRLLSKLKGDFVWQIDYIKYCISVFLLYRESSKYINVLARNTVPAGINAFSWTFYCNLNLSKRFTSSFRFLNCATEMNFPLFPLFNAVKSAHMCVYLRVPPCIVNHELRVTLRGVCVTCALKVRINN